MNNSKKWLSAYLFYAEPWEQLLTLGVTPFIKELSDKNLITRYFFIRYWEKGPHIRLRLQGDFKTLEKEVKPLLIQHFQTYFNNYPSARTDPSKPVELFPNNSIQFIEYEPETERYGGEKGILIAEDQFQLSSQIVLHIIKETPEWTYMKAMGLALQMNLLFALAMGLPKQELKLLFSFFVNHQFINRGEERNKKTGLYENAFQKQKELIKPTINNIIKMYKKNIFPEHSWQKKWILGMKHIHNTLLTEVEKGSILYPKCSSDYKTLGLTKTQFILWHIYESYIHMNNNRLGIKNPDEPFLSYILMQSI